MMIYLLVLMLVSFCQGQISCGGRPYNHVAQFCCMNTVLPRTHGNAYCCSSKYTEDDSEGDDSNSWLGGEVITEPPSNKIQIYNYDTHICCSYNVGSKTFGLVMEKIPNARCCGRKQYDTRVEICLRDKYIIEIPEDNLAPEICGEQLYDSRYQTCCSDYSTNIHNLYDKTSDTMCCMDKLYNTMKQLCCNGVINKRPENGKCCNQTSYNEDKRKCCKFNNIMIISDIIYMDDKPAECCNGKVYSTARSMCCSGNITDRKDFGVCCGTESYNNVEQTCCAGVLQDRVDDYECCGSKAYNMYKQVCCNGKLEARPPNAVRTWY